jgi:hypothetical protein
MARGPTWSGVVFLTQEIQAIWKPSKAATAATDENDLENWLFGKMAAAPNAPPGKARVKQLARAAGHEFSDTAFNRRYAAAVRRAGTPEWSKSGRKSKGQTERPD